MEVDRCGWTCRSGPAQTHPDHHSGSLPAGDWSLLDRGFSSLMKIWSSFFLLYFLMTITMTTTVTTTTTRPHRTTIRINIHSAEKERDCRAEPKQWVTVKGTYKVEGKERTDVTAMQSPPAFLVDDQERVGFDIDTKLRGFEMHYAGAPVQLTYEDTSNLDGLLNEQYIQFNMAEPKHIGGISSQGGFYHETTVTYFPSQETWMTEYIVSYSNDSVNYQFYRNRFNSIQIFRANSDVHTRVLHDLDPAVVSKYVRVHPIKASNAEGGVRQLNARVSLIYCVDDFCTTPRINCLMSEWSEWSECACKGDVCQKSHTRTIMRVQSCGGQKCDGLEEVTDCVEAEPAWRSALIYGGIGLGALLILLLVGLFIYKKTHNDRVEVIVVKDHDDDDVEDMHHPVPVPAPAPPPNFKPSVPPMAAGYPMMGGPRFGGMPMGPRPPFGMRPGMGPGGPGGPGGNGPMGMGGNMGGMAPLE